MYPLTKRLMGVLAVPEALIFVRSIDAGPVSAAKDPYQHPQSVKLTFCTGMTLMLQPRSYELHKEKFIARR